MRITFPLLITIFFQQIAYAQDATTDLASKNTASIKATYHLIFQPDSLNKKQTLQEEFKLLIGPNTSLFVSANRPKQDSAMANVYEQIHQNTGKTISLVGIPRTRFSFYIYKVRASQTLITIEEILTKHYRIEENSAVLAWHILPDTQRVAGYACQLAIVAYGGRHWRTWFTREIPVSDGPYKFSGLPGLIIQVQDTQAFYTFTLTSLTTLRSGTGPIITLPTWPTRPATREQMRQTMYNYKLNPFTFMDTHGDPISGADQQLYHERSKTRNNAIERH